MADLSLKIVPKSRAQRRGLDRAAASAGLKTGPWCLSVALAAARVCLGVSAAAPASNNRVSAPPGQAKIGGAAPRTTVPLVKTYDPDAA